MPENIPNNVMLEPLGLHEYTTVLGANNRVKKFGWINPVRIKYVVENVYNNGYEQCLCIDDSPEAERYKLKITGKRCKKCGGSGWMPCNNPGKTKVKIWVDGIRVK